MSISDSQFKKNDLYVYQLSKPVIESLQLLYFDNHLNECQATVQNEKQINVSDTAVLSQNKLEVSESLHCNSCDINLEDKAEQREHYQTDIHTFNVKRKLHELPSVNKEQFNKLVRETKSSEINVGDNLSIREEGESEGDENQESSDDSEISDDENDIYKQNTFLISEKLNNLEIASNKSSIISHIANQTPHILFKSSLLTQNVFGAYKVLFNNGQIKNPILTLTAWKQNVDQTSSNISALFMIGGGHFAGAIVSHQRLNVSGNAKKQDVSFQEQAILFLEHKTFHRYTTRRKQGGSQSAMDNAKGKANSAGSTLRRYNEAALKIDVQILLKEWKPYLDNCENIYIRARSAQDRKMFLDDGLINKDDVRLKSFPFTTGRPTVSELRKAWCELTYLKITQKPEQIVIKAASEPKHSSKVQKQTESVEKQTPEEKQTEEVIKLLKKGRAPLLISYLRKNKIDKDFTLVPESKYGATPTMLHYASQNGLKQIIVILLSTLKCSPSIKNVNGKTPWDLAKLEPVKQSFQIARYNLGEDFFAWETSNIGEPLSREQVDEINKEQEEQDKVETEGLVKVELENVKKRQKEEYDNKNGPGHKLSGPSLIPSISTEQNLSSLSGDQRRRLMREQRARAAEARAKQNK